MRIFLTLSTSAASSSDNTFRYIFYDTLAALGHDVIFLNYFDVKKTVKNKKNSVDQISEKIYNQFLVHHKKKPFDLFLSYYNSSQVNSELYNNINNHTFSVNYTTNFHQIPLYKPLLRAANLSIYCSKEAEHYFHENATNSYYMPFAGLSSNLNFQKTKNGKISFIGTSYGHRPHYILRCLQKKIPIDVYGSGWVNNHRLRSFLRTLKFQYQLFTNSKDCIDTSYRCLNDVLLKEIIEFYSNSINGFLSDLEYTSLLQESSIILNLPESRFSHDYSNPSVLIGANLRDFEVPTCGSLLLTQANEEIKSLFEDDKEIVTFKNEWEMVDKAIFYLKNPNILLKIAEAGNLRVKKEHLWEHRFTNLFKYLKQNHL